MLLFIRILKNCLIRLFEGGFTDYWLKIENERAEKENIQVFYVFQMKSIKNNNCFFIILFKI